MNNKKFIISKTLRVLEKIRELELLIITTKKAKTFEFPYDIKDRTDQQNNKVRKLAQWADVEGIEWHIR